jgi:hypothetical protein
MDTEIKTNQTEEDGVLFEISFSSTSCLSTIFFIWGNISKVFSMKISKNGIISEAVNDSNTIHITLDIPREKLLHFVYDNISSKGDYVEASFLSAELQSSLPSSGKFITTFMMLKNDFKRMHYIRSISSNREPLLISTINPYMQPSQKYSLNEIPENPIVKILVSELVDAIQTISKEGTPTTYFEMYPAGMKIYGVHVTGTEKGVYPFGNIEDTFEDNKVNKDAITKLSLKIKKMKNISDRNSDRDKNSQVSDETVRKKFIVRQKSENPHCIKIQTDCIKSFTRLRTVCPEGSVLEVFYEPDKPVIFKCPASVFGYIILRIRSQNSLS